MRREPAAGMTRRGFVALAALPAGRLAAQAAEADLRVPQKVLLLEGTTAHVQGIDTDGEHLWVTSVDRAARKGFLAEYSLRDGHLERRIEVQDGERYHPGGIAAGVDAVWVPVAEYKANSTALIQKRSKRTLEVEDQFLVPDHIGCVALMPEFVVGGNWDSRDFYFWGSRGNGLGKLERKVASGTGNAYQDLKFSGGEVVGSGTVAGGRGAVDWLAMPDLKLRRRLTVGTTDTGVPFTREGMALYRNQIWFLPEDGVSRLMVFDLPVA